MKTYCREQCVCDLSLLEEKPPRLHMDNTVGIPVPGGVEKLNTRPPGQARPGQALMDSF